jgi:DNA-binding transcriptional ArsR family regulator
MIVVNNSSQLDHVFNALAHAKRRGMLNTLAYRPATVSQLATEQKLSLPAMHKHIRTLEAAQLIERKKVGRTNFVALNPQSLKTAQDWLAQFHTEWVGKGETLENYLASLKD